MTTIIILAHICVCITLILIVLLQKGKGAGMGAAFGGSSQTVFGSGGASTFLHKATTIAAVVFMLTSFGLSFIGKKGPSSSVMEDVQQAEVPMANPDAIPVAPADAVPAPAGEAPESQP